MFIKIYNELFDYALSPNALKVFLYLSCCRNCLGMATVRTATIQERCAIASASTVRTAIAQLDGKGLLSVQARRDAAGNHISNAYMLHDLHGGWAAMDSAALLLDKSAFSVYAYLFRCANRAQKAFPSLTNISAALSLCRNTVIAAIRVLLQAGLLLKAALRAGKHNLYIVVKKEAAAKQRQTTNAVKVNCDKALFDGFMLLHTWEIVNSGLLKLGLRLYSFGKKVVQKLIISNRLTLSQYKEKEVSPHRA